MAVIGIHYHDGKKAKNLGYTGVYLYYEDGKQEEFSSGDFVKDWFNCKKFIINEEILNKEGLCHSSSVDHFIMDGAPYESAYLHFENEEPVLKYVDHSDENYLFTQREIFQDGWEYFVEKGAKPTWNDLRVRCGLEPLKK